MLLFGVISHFRENRAAIAAETPTTVVTLSADKTTLLPGDTFTVQVNIKSARENSSQYNWHAISMGLGVITAGEDPATFDVPFGKKLSVEKDSEEELLISSNFGRGYASSSYAVTNDATRAERGIVLLSYGRGTSGDAVQSTTEANLTVTLKLSADVDTTVTGFKMGIIRSTYDFVTYANKDNPSERPRDNATDNTKYSINELDITVRHPSSDNTLSSVAVGTKAENVQTYTSTSTPPLADTMSYDYAEAAVLSSVNITPTANNEYATIYMAAGSTAPEQTEANLVESGKEKSIALTSGIRTVTILVKAETGDTKTYTITIVDKYVALSDLKIEVGTKTDGVTKIGLGEDVTFNPETLSYTVDVPSDYASSETGVKITPTIAEGHGIQTTVALTGTNSTPANSSVASGSAVQVTGIANDGTLVVTATASDGSTTKAYTITFKLWSVETGTLTVKVQGAEKQYESDPEKESESVQFYFLLSDEAECKGKFIISSTVTGIPIQVRSASSETAEDYDATKEYGSGTYEIILTAPAGNKAKYVAVITKQEYLELIESSTYQFLVEDVTEEFGMEYRTRVTYAEQNIAHGIDDTEFERIVLGQVADSTTVNDFLANFKESQRNMIRLSDQYGNPVYEFGQPSEGVTESDLADYFSFAVGTGWCIEFGSEANILETIYVSVLGDLDGNGYIDAEDIANMSFYIMEMIDFNNAEERLACYISNMGIVSAEDIASLSFHIMELVPLSSYFYVPEEEVVE